MMHTKLFLLLILVIMVVHGHDCKDYKLTPADQSLIDMVKHYLHTSRKEECPKSTKDTGTRETYVRWGRNSCLKGADVVYTGQVGGNQYSHKAGGVNYLCLPNHPENENPQSYGNNQLFGGEYDIRSSHKPYGWSEKLMNMEVPCAVCSREQRSSLLMILGRKSCFKDWKIEYNGYLMSDHYTHRSRYYSCVDMDPEILKSSSSSSLDGALFYPIRTTCGSLKCPPYKDKRDVYCVVCSK